MVTYTTTVNDSELVAGSAVATEYKYASSTSTHLALNGGASASMLTPAGTGVASLGTELAVTKYFATSLTQATARNNSFMIAKGLDRRYARIPDNAILVEYA